MVVIAIIADIWPLLLPWLVLYGAGKNCVFLPFLAHMAVPGLLLKFLSVQPSLRRTLNLVETAEFSFWFSNCQFLPHFFLQAAVHSSDKDTACVSEDL